MSFLNADQGAVLEKIPNCAGMDGSGICEHRRVGCGGG